MRLNTPIFRPFTTNDALVVEAEIGYINGIGKRIIICPVDLLSCIKI